LTTESINRARLTTESLVICGANVKCCSLSLLGNFAYLLQLSNLKFNYDFSRFEIEKKLRQAKKKEQKKKAKKEARSTPKISIPPDSSSRSKERRKTIEDKKDKKMSAFLDLKARREKKKELQGKRGGLLD
jgi:hypothetical protein